MKTVCLLAALLLALGAEGFSLGPSLCTGEAPVHSYAEYLAAFRKGPCSPVLFHHGHMGVLLQVEADCPRLRAAKDSSPEAAFVLEKCAFMCRWGRARYEETIWVNSGPIWKYLFWNGFNFLWKRRECAMFLMAAHKRREPSGGAGPGYRYEELEVPGVRVRVFGDTDSTRAQSKCGSKAVDSIMGAGTKSYGRINDFLESLGYVQGLSLQHNIYDFRLRSTRNGVIERARLGLRTLKAFTGKKAVVMAHSYGNNAVMNALLRMTQREKDALVEEYVAIASPFLGSLESLFTVLGQSGSFYFPFIKEKLGWDWLSKFCDGINPPLARIMYPYIDPLYEFLSSPAQVEPLMARIVAAKESLVQTGLPRALLDKLEADLDRALNGVLVTKQYGGHGPANQYSLRDIEPMMKDLVPDPFFYKYFRQFDYEAVSCHRNPGVPTRLVFLSEVETMASVTFFEDPTTAFDNYRFPRAQNGTGSGDQTVGMFSSVSPPMTWFLDWLAGSAGDGRAGGREREDNGHVKHTVPKRVSFVELGFDQAKAGAASEHYEYLLCSDAPVDSDAGPAGSAGASGSEFFSGKLETLSALAKEFSAFALGPASKLSSDGFLGGMAAPGAPVETCNHRGLMSNPRLFHYLKGVLSGSRAQAEEAGAIDLGVGDEEVQRYIDECPVVTCHRGLDECLADFRAQFTFAD